VASRARPFFDSGGGAEETAAAISCFASLAAYAIGEESRSVYCEHANGALVSLLIHADDGLEDGAVTTSASATANANDASTTAVCQAARQALSKIFSVFLSEGGDAPSISEEGNVDYVTLLSSVSNCEAMSDMLPTYAATAAGYFRAAHPSTRANAVRLVSALLATMSGQAATEIDSAAICGSLTALMLGDRTRTVQEAVAANIGHIFVHLSKANRLRD